MKTFLLAALLGMTAPPSVALAADTTTSCACGQPGCGPEACTCSQGVCPLHRPKTSTPPSTTKSPEPQAEKKAEPAPKR